MFGFLFRTLTAEPYRGTPVFDSITTVAREKHWYAEGTVPDTIDGRFAVLATITALVLVRLEGEQDNSASVALTERFIEVMESEHRELGIGDPTLGKTVRKLVGSLARRTELWRLAVAGERDWKEAARESLYRGAVSPEALLHVSGALTTFWKKLGGIDAEALKEGKLR